MAKSLKNLFFANNFFKSHFDTKVSLVFWSLRKKYGSFDTHIGLFWEKKFLTLYMYSEPLKFWEP
jgi:hypothetical protein